MYLFVVSFYLGIGNRCRGRHTSLLSFCYFVSGIGMDVSVPCLHSDSRTRFTRYIAPALLEAVARRKGMEKAT